jgi:hypothetical protein
MPVRSSIEAMNTEAFPIDLSKLELELPRFGGQFLVFSL